MFSIARSCFIIFEFCLVEDFHLSNNTELIMTTMEPALCTWAPITGFKTPVIARIIATKFRIIEKARLYFMATIIFFAKLNKCGNSLISSFISTISAASTAMSLPIQPMAMPSFAFFNAGASLIPSPTNISFPFFFSRLSSISSFSTF